MAPISPSPSRPLVEKSQYHHFIPRFILRNFAYASPKTGYKIRRGNGRQGKNQSHGDSNGKDTVHTLDLSGATAQLIEAPLSRIFGQVDMYRDFAKAKNQQYIENQLADLESLAGMVFSKICKSFEAGAVDVWISRLERDTLRKFLFIMKYRSSNMHKRFCHESADEYCADDRERLLAYMKKKGFIKPIEVWFDNIKAMLKLKMDPRGLWMEEIRKRAYPDDAEWFILHTQGMYMALCTPSTPEEEFLLTENGYGIHEGPVSAHMDPKTGNFITTSYTEYHVFSVISPRLMIVLRSFLLPNPLEDNSNDIREFRQTCYQQCASMHNVPDEANSILADLPISKARNSYTRIVDGQAVLLAGEDGTQRASHRFGFPFFPITAEQVHKINFIMLEESYRIRTIVFGTPAAAKKTIEYYLTMALGKRFKVVSSKSDDRRLVFLRKLEGVIRAMGSDVTAVYHTLVDPPTEEEWLEEFSRVAAESLPEQPTAFMQLYMKIGGSRATLIKDMDQGRKMLNMRIKFDVWSTGLNERFRQTIRENLEAVFCQLPVRRVWYYLKFYRAMMLSDGVPDETYARGDDMMADGPEDTIARVSQVIRSQDLARLMFAAVLKQIHLIQHPDVDVYPKITSEEGLLRVFQSGPPVAFDIAGQLSGFSYYWIRVAATKMPIDTGSICDCGA
ncbi:hypothetical protein V495_03503 [Pseudogymnoascus sp. VKM F-4514 (FW-929)]|nr:hypothetical protein V495_03503 [Pseudogymnoascus sp. VKM F-4514 (FW-929)]KFY56363.1 hypothetical protein V497_06328 [Pseudogymnoascus sp. VKM F-4516 (FW-969)]